MRYLTAFLAGCTLAALTGNQPRPDLTSAYADLCPDEIPAPVDVRAAYRAQLVEGLIDGWAREIDDELDDVVREWSA